MKPQPFKESQKFNQPWFWGILVFSGGVILFSLWNKLSSTSFQTLMFGDLAPIVIFCLVSLFLVLLRLDIKIDDKGICYKWYPFQHTYKVIPWNRIESIRIRRYSALAEFGGYGLRYTIKTTAFIVSGNSGIEITYPDKKRTFLLGVIKPDLAREVIQEHFRNVIA